MSHRDLQRKLEVTKAVTHSCPGCTGPVKCDISQGKSNCWCFHVKPQQREHDFGDLCLCPTCLVAGPLP